MPHPDHDKLLQFYRGARADPPAEYRHAAGVVPSPTFFSVAALAGHLSNPLLPPAWLQMIYRGQRVPLESAYFFKTVQQRQLCFMDKRTIDDYLRKGASIVLEGLDILDPEINELCAQLDAGLPASLVNCVAFFSQQKNELYRGHIDSDDVLVIQVAGEKLWRLHAKQPAREVNLSELTPQQMGAQIAEVRMRPGDALYVRSGVPHFCETPGSHSLHLSFDLCDRTLSAEEIWRAAYARFELASLPPYAPAAEVAKRLSSEMGSEALAAAIAAQQEAVRQQARAFRERIGSSKVSALARLGEAQPSGAAAFSRASPSPRYAELLALYRRMHEEGEKFLGIAPSDTFNGQSLAPQIARIRALLRRTGARTVLDYGCGKAMHYELPVTDGGERHPSLKEYWGVDSVQRYDPAFAPFSELPRGQFDAVICTDVLEHCPEQDLEWIVEELFSYARRAVFANVASYPAQKRLPNGENAHCTILQAAQWEALFGRAAARHPDLLWELWVDERAGGRQVERRLANFAPAGQVGRAA